MKEKPGVCRAIFIFGQTLASITRDAPQTVFLVFAAVLYGMMLFVLATPALDLWLFETTGWSLLAGLGQGPSIGPGKLLIMRLVLLTGMGLLSVGYAVLWTKQGKVIRLLILISTVLLIMVTWTMLRRPDLRTDRISNLEIRQLPHPAGHSIFHKYPFPVSEIKTEDQFFEHCHSLFLQHREALETTWQIDDPKKLEALFYMNLVSGLWGFGNAREVERVGCVRCNEITGFENLKTVTIQTYLKSEIGCCTDYAYLMKLLLDRAGIANRRVATASHVFNEAKFQDGWDSIDANLNLWFEGDWKSIQRPTRTNDRIVVTVFPHHNLLIEDNPHYRPAVGHFRLHALLNAIHKTAPVVDYPDGK